MRGNHSLKKEFKFFSVLKIIIELAIIGAVISLIALDISNNISKTKKEKEISAVIYDSFTALKNSDKESINKYLDYNSLISGLDEKLIKEGEYTEFEKELFSNISWTIERNDINNDEAIVIIEVTNKNFKSILTKWMKNLIKNVNDGNEIAEKEALSRLEELVKKESDTRTELKKIKLKKYEDSWKIEVNDDLIDLVFPGIDSVTELIK